MYDDDDDDDDVMACDALSGGRVSGNS